MNSNDLFDELLSNKVEYDKNEVTVESVLEDLDIFDVDLTNLINNSSENKKEEKKDNKELVKEENKENINKEDKEEIKENVKQDNDDLLNKILNENIDDILKGEILEEGKKDEQIKEEQKNDEIIKENEKNDSKFEKEEDKSNQFKKNENVETKSEIEDKDKEDLKHITKNEMEENKEKNQKKNIKESQKEEIEEITKENKNEKEDENDDKIDDKKDNIKEDLKDNVKEDDKNDILIYKSNRFNEEKIIENEDYNIQKKELEKEFQLLEKEKKEKLKKELERKEKGEERIKKQKEEEEKERMRREEEEKINKIKEEQKKKLESFIPQFPNPIDFIQYIEILRVNTKISGEMNNFLLKNHIKKNNKYNVSVISSFYEISKILSKEDVNLIFSKRDLLIACTLKGEIFAFLMDTQELINRILQKNINCQTINCLDITDDLQDVICGYQDGTITLINVSTGEIKYTTNKIHKDSSCLEIKIYKKEKENEIFFISSGEDGQLFYNSFKKSIFWKLTSKLILKNNSPIFLIKFVTFSMKTHYYYQNLNCLKKFVIFGSLQEIKFYCLEPKIEQIFEIKKPEHIKEKLIPDAQIGIGRMPEIFMRFKKTDVKNHLLMIISWGNIIYFYQLPIINEIIIKGYKEIGYYINMFNILRIGFLNSSVIFCLDKTFTITILDTSKITTGKIKFSGIMPETPKNNDFAEIEKSMLISEFILNQKKIDDCETYLYTIIDNNSSLQILSDKQILCFNLVDWDIFLKELQKSKDYLNLFSVGINLYFGKMLSFSNIPERKLLKRTVGNFLKDIIIKYIDLTIAKKKSEIKEPIELQKINECINITIEFFIEIDSVEFLLRSIEPLFEEKEYGPLFCSKLESIILCDRAMKSILPSDIILNLIDLYNKNDKLEIISQLLLHMNLITLDNPEIIEKLKELNLFIPLIYIL